MFGIQSALNPHGPEAAGIAGITWVLVGGAGIIFVSVMLLAAIAVFGRRPWQAGEGLIISGGIVLPAVVLAALLINSLRAAPRVPAGQAPDVAIEVVGHQWWWEVRYLDARGETEFATANEIHIPAGRLVELKLRSADVLHSFWVPALAGKLDMIPGKDNRLLFSANAAGVFRGQCAEYCGGPHAQMAFFVVAEEPRRFEAWRTAQLRQRDGDESHPGRHLFLSHCASCHTVRGTTAAGKLGPDLTHFASRFSLGAGILPNHPGTVAGWITGSQHLKPGNLMPEFRQFDGEQLRALAGWLETLR